MSIEEPEGTDKTKDELFDEPMLVRINYYNAKFSDPELVPYYLIVNEYNMYVLESEESGYRGVNASMLIKNLYSKDHDDVRMGQCCQQIGTVKPMLFGNINNQVSYNCFAAEDFVSKQSWTICDTDHDKVSELRETLILAVIKYGLSTFGIYGLEELMKFQKMACEDPKGWTYAYQSRWPCMCPEGMMQSPIDIHVPDTINTTSIRVDFRRWDTPVTSYVEMLYP